MSRGPSPLDLSGQRFGRLVAVRHVPTQTYGRSYSWRCRCDCGQTHVVSVSVLRSGRTKSCGCLRRELLRSAAPRYKKRPYEWLFNALRRTARERGLECSISFEEFVSFTKRVTCTYCSAPVVWNDTARRGQTRSTNLDRKNNALGYVSSNVVVCCWECNDGKGDRYTFAEWSAMMRALRRFRASASS